MNRTIVDALLKMSDNEDDFNTSQRRVLFEAAKLLQLPVRTILITGYKHGFLDGVQQDTRGANVHIKAKQMAAPYADRMLAGGVVTK